MAGPRGIEAAAKLAQRAKSRRGGKEAVREEFARQAPDSLVVWRDAYLEYMLEGGADIRFIQQLLGHAKLDTTAIYTEVSILQLQEVHARCHPSARLSEASTLAGTAATVTP